jgi:hypothetical protein
VGVKCYDLWPIYPRESYPVAIVRWIWCAPGPVWTGAENLTLTGIRSPETPARSNSLCRPRYLLQAVMINITAFRNLWSYNLVDIDVRFGKMSCLHFQCGSGSWCSSLNLTGVTWYKLSVNLYQNTWGSVKKGVSLGEIYSSPLSYLTSEACGPFILSYWCVAGLVHDI